MVEKIDAFEEINGLMKKVRTKKYMLTSENRYGFEVNVISQLAKKFKNKKIVIHLIGVGYESKRMKKNFFCPQPAEIIKAIKKSTKKNIEIHLIDISEKALNKAKEECQELLEKGDKINVVKTNIGLPNLLPVNKADISVCTNVLYYLTPPSELRESGFHALVSSLKKGGVLLVDDASIERKYLKTPINISEYGLKEHIIPEKKRVKWKEKYGQRNKGKILIKEKEIKPFEIFWKEKKVKEVS